MYNGSHTQEHHDSMKNYKCLINKHSDAIQSHTLLLTMVDHEVQSRVVMIMG